MDFGAPSMLPIPQQPVHNPTMITEQQRAALLEVCQGLSEYRNRNRRIIALRYLDVPSPEENVEYYTRIASPRSINTVKRALEEYRYTSVQQVYTDLTLIFLNGQAFHNKSSEVWRDAERLYEEIDEIWAVHERILGPASAMQHPVKRTSNDDGSSRSTKKSRISYGGYSAPETDAIHQAYIQGGMFQSAEDSLSPNNSGMLSAPMDEDLNMSPSAGGAPDLAALLQMAQSGGQMDSNPPSGLQTPGLTTPTLEVTPKSAKGKQKSDGKKGGRRSASVISAEDDAADGIQRSSRGEDRYPDQDPGWLQPTLLPYPAQGQILTDIFNKIKNARDPQTGRLYCAGVLRAPPPTVSENYYKIRDPVTLEIIEARLIGNQYSNPILFDQDLKKMFADARIWMDRSNEIQYGDVLTLQRIYHDATRLDGITAQEQTDSTLARNNNDADLVLLKSVNFKGEVYKIGDWIHLYNENKPTKCIPGQIFKLYKRKDSQQRGMSVMWYLRPEETIHPATRFFYVNEVFKKHNTTEHHVEDIVERCLVMFYNRYNKGRPKPPVWYPGMPTYVCECRYKDKTMKKIKSWGTCVPEEVKVFETNGELDPNISVNSSELKKVKSPFAQDGPAQPETADTRRQAPLKKAASGSSGAALLAQQNARNHQQQSQIQVYAATGPTQSIMPGPRPIEVAAETDQFHPLPEELASRFRCDPSTGDVLWFTAPPGPQVLPPSRPSHSLEYLAYLARKGQQQAVSAAPRQRKRSVAEVLEDYAARLDRGY